MLSTWENLMFPFLSTTLNSHFILFSIHAIHNFPTSSQLTPPLGKLSLSILSSFSIYKYQNGSKLILVMTCEEQDRGEVLVVYDGGIIGESGR